MKIEVKNKLNEIVEAIIESGYGEPYTRLKFYVITDSDLWITRARNSRENIKKISKEDIHEYIENESKKEVKT